MNETDNKPNISTASPSTPQQCQQSSTSQITTQLNQTKTNLNNNKQSDNSKIIKAMIIVGLILVAIGLFIHSFGIDYAKIEFNEEGAIADFVGKLIIKIGMIISSIMLIIFALYMEKYDVTLRFGCLLVSGVIIAFEMLSFI